MDLIQPSDMHLGGAPGPKLKVDEEHSYCTPCLHLLISANDPPASTPGPQFQIGKDDRRQRGGYMNHHSKESLRTAMQQGCAICAQIWSSLQIRTRERDIDFQTQSERIKIEARSPAIYPERCSLEFKISGFLGLEDQMEPSFISFPIKQNSHPNTSCLQLRPLSEATTDTKSVDIKGWLETCDSSHECASDISGQTYVPPRLLHVHGDIIRIEDSATLSKPSSPLRYMTLSHCWGTQRKPFCLTSTNYSTFRDGISLSELPLTFQHAIEISLKLEVPWIWIDSLCIIQEGLEHEQDWQVHVMEMSSIYGNCYVNIAASFGSNSSDGCFIKREKGDCERAVVHLQSGPHCLLAQQHESILNWPLNSRAWVFQERLLAPRVLHFGSTDVYFECSKGLVSGKFPDNFPLFKRDDVHSLSDFGIWMPFEWRMSNAFPAVEDVAKRWQSLCVWYSKCLLSYPTDRFPAVAGIAKRFNQSHLNDEFIAGFFKSQLPSALMWQVFFLKDRRLDRYQSYIAPSWSWMSVPGGIDFETIHGTILEIHGYERKLVDPMNEYGRLAYAAMDAEGWRLKFPLAKCTMGTRTPGRSCKMYGLTKFMGETQHTLISIEFDHIGGQFAPDLEVIALCVAEEKVPKHEGGHNVIRILDHLCMEHGPPLSGLALVASTCQNETNSLEYRRIGLVKIYFCSPSEDDSISGDQPIPFRKQRMRLV